MMNPKHYSYRVIWSEDDQEYVGLCEQFPSLSHLDSDQMAALQGITALVCDVVVDMLNHGEPLPDILTERVLKG